MKRALPIQLTFFVILLALSVQAVAQQYDLQVYGPEQGLPSIQVNDICQDKDAALWIATNTGVSQFDGQEFKNFSSRDGLAENVSTSIFCDSQGRVWIGHRTKGVTVIGADSVWVWSEANGLINNEVHDIHEDQRGRIHVATYGGVAILDENGWQHMTTRDGLSSNNTHSIAQHSDGSIWIGTYGSGITVIRNGETEQINTANGLVNDYITSLYPHQGRMLIGTLGGLSIWENGSVRNISVAAGLSNGQVNDVSVSRIGDVWLGTYQGADRLRNGSILSLGESNGLPDNEVLSVLNDLEGNTWLGTVKGLVKVQNLAFAHYHSSDDQEIEPTAIYRDSKGVLWAGNEAGGVLRFNGQQFVPAFDDPDLNDRQISSISEDGDGNIWFGTMDFGGLFQWNGERLFIYSDEFGLADNNINCLLKDDEGNLLIGTPSGLSVFDGLDFRIIPVSNDPFKSHVTVLANVPNTGILIGTTDGRVLKLEGPMAEEFVELNTSSPITGITESPFGLAIATQVDGTFLLKDGQQTNLNDSVEMNGSSVRSITSDGDRLYLGTARGLCEVWSMNGALRVRVYDEKKGFQGTSCKRGSILADDDRIWVGTGKGITCFVRSEYTEDLFEPRTFITDLQLDYSSMDWASLGFQVNRLGIPTDLELPYSKNSLRFHFKGINLHRPEGVTYKWKLEGFERSWNPNTDQTYANYPNLPPGTYTFKLRACNSANICTSEPVRCTFTITPPFWQTLGFYVAVSVIIIILTYFFIKLREQRLLQEKRVLETTVTERTSELREQKEIVEAQNAHITESIDYARNIQMAILPSESEMQRAFDGHFVFYRPKDVVGGDFYWVFSKGDISWAAAVDCTGHGVAGAFMSMIGSDLLNQIIIEKQLDDPAKVLDEMDKGIKLAFAQSAKEFESDQGMDMALVRLDRKNRVLEFAGAQRPLYIMSDGEMIQYEGARHSISCAEQRGAQPFTKHVHHIKENSFAYLFSDGIPDQFGGPRGKKFMIRRVRDFFQSHGTRPINEQYRELVHTLDDWQGTEHEQVDDMVLLGIRLG